MRPYAVKSFVRFGLVFAIAIAPLLVDWVAKNVVHPRPFWVHFYDPETIYFYEGLRLLRGVAPVNIDNPGTTLQIASSVIAAATGPTPLRYESFLAVAHLLALLATLGAMLLLLIRVIPDASPAQQLVCLWSYFLAPQALQRLDVWSPEIVYFPMAVAALAVMWPYVGTQRVALFGFVLGLGVATKLTLLAALAAGFAAVTLTDARRLVRFCAAALGGFVLGTLPIVTRYGEMAGRLRTLAAVPRDRDTWTALLASSRGWLCWVALILISVWFRTGDARRRQLLIFGVLLLVTPWLLAIRNPAFRYLLPSAVGLVALTIVLAMKRSPRLDLALAIVAALLLAKNVRDDIVAEKQRTDTEVAIRQHIERALPVGAVTVYGWRSPEPAFALRIFAPENELIPIDERYRRVGHYDHWKQRVMLPHDVSHWDYAVLQPDDARRFPEPLGDRVATVPPFDIYAAPRR